MSLRHKSIGQLQEADLQNLKDNKVPEGREIEYKEVLPGGSDDEKREFLADVSSFANASGGDIIYGIKQNAEAEPDTICGLNISASLDDVILRLTNIIQTGVEPRITGLHVEAIQLAIGKPVVIIRVAKSWASPHMVTFKNFSRFFTRDSRGKHQMDVSEIRTNFNLSSTALNDIRNFRLERLGKVIGEDLTVTMPPGAKIVLHLIPFNAFGAGNIVDTNQALKYPNLHKPLDFLGYWSHRTNADGFMTYSAVNPSHPYKTPSYMQVFRSGIIEAVDSTILSLMGENKVVPKRYEAHLVKALPLYLELLETLGVNVPIFVMLSLVGVKNFTVETGPSFRIINREVIDKDVLQLPELILEDFKCDASEVFHPVFDIVWNAGGFESSFNYDKHGKWVSPVDNI